MVPRCVVARREHTERVGGDRERFAALAPFSQPGLVTIPLGFLVLVVVSLLTQPRPHTR